VGVWIDETHPERPPRPGCEEPALGGESGETVGWVEHRDDGSDLTRALPLPQGGGGAGRLLPRTSRRMLAARPTTASAKPTWNAGASYRKMIRCVPAGTNTARKSRSAGWIGVATPSMVALQPG